MENSNIWHVINTIFSRKKHIILLVKNIQDRCQFSSDRESIGIAKKIEFQIMMENRRF